MSKAAVLLLLLSMTRCLAQDRNMRAQKPEMAGFSAERLQTINVLMQKYVDEKKLPGMITIAARRGKVFFREKYGFMDSGKSMQFDAIFRIASMTKPPQFLSGNGGLFSTANDYMAFLQMLLNKGQHCGIRLLQSNTVDLMTANHITKELLPDDDFFGPLLSGMGFGYGFAVLLGNQSVNRIGSAGAYWWSGAANTYFFIDPQKELILIFMTQFVPNFHYPVFKEFKEIVYKSMIAPH
jgi:CubicO group peptidase (beta-lactamase class C family)